MRKFILVLTCIFVVYIGFLRQSGAKPGHVTSRDPDVNLNMASCSWDVTDQGNNVKKLSHPRHANTLLNALNESRKVPVLCDGVVVIRNTEIPVQKNILAAASPYFRLGCPLFLISFFFLTFSLCLHKPGNGLQVRRTFSDP